MSKIAELSLPPDLAAAYARQRALGDAASAAAQDRYEQHLIAEARAIADRRVNSMPTAEHVRVILARLDARAPINPDRAPF